MTRLAIIEDNRETLKYLEALLSGAAGIGLVGVFSSGKEALSKKFTLENAPDVFLVDLNLPDMSGIDLIIKLKDRTGKAEVLVLTMHDDKEHLLAAFKAGATGYLLKGASSADIITAITDVARGGVPMSPKIARSIIEEFKNDAVKNNGMQLTPKEKEVLYEISNCLSERKAADKLSLSPHTIHAHIKNIYKKLQVKSKTEAIMKAKAKGII